MKPKYVALVGGIVMIDGSLLPWVSPSSMFGTNKNGIQGDGIYTLICGVAVILASIVAREKPGKRCSVLAALFGIFGGILAVFSLVNFDAAARTINRESVFAAVGIGIYVTLIGAAVTMVGGLMKSPASLPQKQETLTASTISASTMPAAPSASVTDKLSDLKVMLDKNLVTQDEYDAKRAELLKQI